MWSYERSIGYILKLKFQLVLCNDCNYAPSPPPFRSPQITSIKVLVAPNEWFSSNQRLSYAHRIMGSPGGKHWKSLQRNVWRGAVSPFKTSVFGQRMPHFAVILWEAEVTNVGALIVSFCGINAMKSIDKHSFLRKVDCEIYWMVSKYIVLTYQV